MCVERVQTGAQYLPTTEQHRASAEERNVLASAPQDEPASFIHQEIVPAPQFASNLYEVFLVAQRVTADSNVYFGS